jgi:hypothetical protein
MYVEVYYLTKDKKQCTGRKWQACKDGEADSMYMRTIGKMLKENKTTLVALRKDNHELIKSEIT